MGLQDSVMTTVAGFVIDPDAMPEVKAATLTLRDGTTRSVYVKIEWNPPATPQEIEIGAIPSMLIKIVNDATKGASASEINRGGGDKLNMALFPGRAAEDIELPAPSEVSAWFITYRIGKA